MSRISIKSKDECTGCAACYSACTFDCISMRADDEGFLYPTIDTSICRDCGQCTKTCNRTMVESKHTIMCIYGVKSKCDEVRLQSSSGGVFSLLAEEVIKKNGRIFGASFDDNWNVRHASVNSLEDLEQLRGSKYVQSMILDTYKEVKRALNYGELVYYSGTPCQIAGLKAYLNKDFDNLITQDFICHGVPSPMIWESYRDDIAKYRSIKRISFRDKALSWSRFSLTVDYINDKSFSEDLTENAFLRGFLNNLFLRPSCHACRYKGEKRVSDITLADYWGCNQLSPQLYDEKGCSLVFVNTHKGQDYLDRILNKTSWIKIEGEQVYSYNSAAIRSVKPHKNRDDFFNNYEHKNTEKYILSFLGDTPIKKSFRIKKRKIRSKLSSIKRSFLKDEKDYSV